VTLPGTDTRKKAVLSPSILLFFVLASLLVLPRTDLRPIKESAEAAGTRQWSCPANEYNSNTVPTSHTNRGSCSVRVLGYELENSPHPGPATEPGHTVQKQRRLAYARAVFFPTGWTRRWKRSLTRLLAVVSCTGGQGGEPGAGSSCAWTLKTERNA
jgi:hypothetical protein